MKDKKLDNYKLILILIVVIFAFIVFRQLGIIQKDVGNHLDNMFNDVTNSAAMLEEADSNEEKEAILNYMTKDVRENNNSLKMIAEKSFLFKSYNTNDLWRYVSSINSSDLTIDEKCQRVKDLSSLIEKTEIGDILSDEGYIYVVDSKGCKDKLGEILESAKAEDEYLLSL